MKKIINLLNAILTFKRVIWLALIIAAIVSIIFVYWSKVDWKTALLSFFFSIIQLSIGILIVNVWLEKRKEKTKQQEEEKQKQEKQEVADTISKLFRRHIRGFNKNLWQWAVNQEYDLEAWRNLIISYITHLKANERGYHYLPTNDRGKIKKIILAHYKDFKPLILDLQIVLDEISQLINWHLDSRLYTNTINAKYQIRSLLDSCQKLSRKMNSKKTQPDASHVDDDATCTLLEIDIYSQETLRILDAMLNSNASNTNPDCVPT
jgi:membrane protein implicated in regulation of membrane protease activity